MYTDPSQYSDAVEGMFSGVGGLLYFAFLVLALVAMWRIFTKAGEAGWKSIIPIYNTIVLLKIVGRPIWWILLLLIPVVNVVVLVIVYNDLSKSFGHGVGFTLGLIFLGIIFIMILAFGDSRYVGPGGVARMAPVPAYRPPNVPPAPPAPPA